MATMRELPSIREILENWTSESDSEVQAFLHLTLPEVSSLSLTSARIGDGGISALGRALQKRSCPRLEALDLSGNEIGSTGMSDVATAIETGNLSNLRELYYIDRLFGDDQVATLASALGSGSVRALKSLALGGCWQEGGVVGRQGVEALSAAFQSGNLWLLEELSLNWVRAPWSNWGNSLERSKEISQEGVAGIMRALEAAQLVVLRSLHFRNCSIGEEEAKAIGIALQQPHFSSLGELRVQFEDIEGGPTLSPIGFHSKAKDGILAEALFGAFKTGNLSSLKILDLKGVELQEQHLLELAGVLEAGHLPGLILLTLSSPITHNFAKALVRAYRKNRYLVAELQQPNMGRVAWPNLSSHIKADGFRRLNMEFVKSRHIPAAGEPLSRCSSEQTILSLTGRLTLVRRTSFKALKKSLSGNWFRCCVTGGFEQIKE
ncbi:hypothetical protein MPTK1_2g10400 [Marchantia polymorpha subsp. ruderalis]|nr:hypothetical protein MARPO_0023s0009 [Marchantia polymorpha]BBN01802.1 hypothetical protein Mp_2g10400 [Marchantia polymorpha subsp. ruderalis]|eukprot:PTQ43665.1 hypothetical protein MARPO_0023s0009 [Marchantia polymorpha]